MWHWPVTYQSQICRWDRKKSKYFAILQHVRRSSAQTSFEQHWVKFFSQFKLRPRYLFQGIFLKSYLFHINSAQYYFKNICPPWKLNGDSRMIEGTVMVGEIVTVQGRGPAHVWQKPLMTSSELFLHFKVIFFCRLSIQIGKGHLKSAIASKSHWHSVQITYWLDSNIFDAAKSRQDSNQIALVV